MRFVGFGPIEVHRKHKKPQESTTSYACISSGFEEDRRRPLRNPVVLHQPASPHTFLSLQHRAAFYADICDDTHGILPPRPRHVREDRLPSVPQAVVLKLD